jgi:AcrR family transcriptional regulator
MSPRRSAENADATRRALMSAAKKLFATRGYTDTPTEEVVHRAGVTRGALYHHFDSKETLFQAVFEEVTQEIVRRALDAKSPATDAWEDLSNRAQAFLDACVDPAIVRIAFIDAPSVLGWERWRELDAAYGMKVVQDAFQEAMDAGLIAAQPVAPLSHIVLGALNEAAVLIARASDRDAVRAQVGEIVNRLLQGLRATP